MTTRQQNSQAAAALVTGLVLIAEIRRVEVGRRHAQLARHHVIHQRDKPGKQNTLAEAESPTGGTKLHLPSEVGIFVPPDCVHLSAIFHSLHLLALLWIFLIPLDLNINLICPGPSELAALGDVI